MACSCFFFFNDTATTEIYTLSLHDALPICVSPSDPLTFAAMAVFLAAVGLLASYVPARKKRSEEHTSELQSHLNLVCRLLLEKKKKNKNSNIIHYETQRATVLVSDEEICHL